MSKQGKETGIFGKWLYDYCKRNNLPFEIYYDHGNKELDTHVAKTQGFYGKDPSRLTNLAEVDIIIGSKDENVLLLIEIEERQASPKKILGNAFAIMMCNAFAIKDKKEHKKYRPMKETQLFIACWFNPNGKCSEKILNLKHRFKEIDGFDGGISSDKITFIIEDNLETLLVKLKKEVKNCLKNF